MTPSGPTYDATLGDDGTNETNLAEQGVISFKGKVKIGSDKTEADIQRERLIAEANARADDETLRKEQHKVNREEEQKQSRFTNSKGNKNAGLFMQDGGNTMNAQNGVTTTEEKRQFTNSKKPKQLIPEPQLDPNVATVTNAQPIVAKNITVKGWD